MNQYLSKQEKGKIINLTLMYGCAAEVVKEYEDQKTTDKEFLRNLKTGMTWLKKAIDRRKSFLDIDAAHDFARQVDHLAFRIIPNDKAKKVIEEAKNSDQMIIMDRDDFIDWCEMVLPFTCQKCEGKEHKKCKLKVMLTKFSAYPVNPKAEDECPYSYAGVEDAPEGKTIFREDINPEEVKETDDVLQALKEEAHEGEQEEQNNEDTCHTEINMDNGQVITVELPRESAENICKAFYAHHRPVFAAFEGEDIFEVDLAKASVLNCDGIGRIELQEKEYRDEHKERPAYNERQERDFKKKKKVHVMCQACGSEYDDDVPDFFTRVRCRDCGQWVYLDAQERKTQKSSFKEPVNLFGSNEE